ncbi:hypothetical protein K437DRAFT_294320 [Tilletiaria anomala UBC 951]|uniref:Uncharacterized protein n=1 Tax=Tilletiaria anomala (strain ATCC 24038 / CBS 436.72 / UBC 951) TaxID=1037660 RepID=A0A066W5Y4_TILAU|nr:uncharacterized protein K437DRAFT_294320 [Tilletiaria anomala UBC 951]KDN46494.1 hypothetical protein K437DRAFT_294320 [Tilletiaria anomala UBC 951]
MTRSPYTPRCKLSVFTAASSLSFCAMTAVSPVAVAQHAFAPSLSWAPASRPLVASHKALPSDADKAARPTLGCNPSQGPKHRDTAEAQGISSPALSATGQIIALDVTASHIAIVSLSLSRGEAKSITINPTLDFVPGEGAQKYYLGVFETQNAYQAQIIHPLPNPITFALLRTALPRR